MLKRPSAEAVRLELFALLDERPVDATICPSEVARRLTAGAEGWRALLPLVRSVAAALAQHGALQVTRQGTEVDALAGGGPIRLGRPPHRTPT